METTAHDRSPFPDSENSPVRVIHAGCDSAVSAAHLLHPQTIRTHGDVFGETRGIRKDRNNVSYFMNDGLIYVLTRPNLSERHP
jgi:hypothetical protein